VDEDQERRILRLAGLGVRGRNAVVGVDQVRRAAEKGRVRLGLVAADASRHSRDKLVPLLKARGVAIIEMPSAARLGEIAGRAQTTAIGVVDAQLARGIREATKNERSGAGDRDGSAGGIG
jgi:ribosomal protein L7Ae-like RNA K-turn-binding protein